MEAPQNKTASVPISSILTVLITLSMWTYMYTGFRDNTLHWYVFALFSLAFAGCGAVNYKEENKNATRIIAILGCFFGIVFMVMSISI